MRLDLVSEQSERAEVRWTKKDKHVCVGVTVLDSHEYKIILSKKRFRRRHPHLSHSGLSG